MSQEFSDKCHYEYFNEHKSKVYQYTWEIEPWARGWLGRGRSAFFGRCNLCKKELRAGKSELKKHAKSTVHMRLVYQAAKNPVSVPIISNSKTYLMSDRYKSKAVVRISSSDSNAEQPVSEQPVSEPQVSEQHISEQPVSQDGFSEDLTDTEPEVTQSKPRLKVYQDSWEKEDWSKGWLERGRTKFHAKCKICKKELRAGKSELQVHAYCTKHMKLLLKASKSVTTTTSYLSKDSRTFMVYDAAPSMDLNQSRAKNNNRLAYILTPVGVKHAVREWFREDAPSFDYAGFVVGEKEESAVLLMKEEGVFCGKPFFEAIFKELDCNVEWYVEEGDLIKPIERIAKIRGKVRHLLLGERIALNCVTRASGIATIARRFSCISSQRGWKGEIAGTRKTTPGFRLVEKYALLVGGVSTHRHDLSSMIMIKDNHIWTAGSISQAVKDARVVGGFSAKIEVECRSVAQAQEAATAGAEIVMLDNFSPQAVQQASEELKAQFPMLIIEVSGGVTEDTVAHFMGPHVDVISCGKLTQGYQTIDLSFKIQKHGVDATNPVVCSGSI